MLFQNLSKIIRGHYSALDRGNAFTPVISKAVIFFIFFAIPAAIGSILGIISPLTTNIVAPFVTVLGVLTGFSINAVLLLFRYSEDKSYEEEIQVVEQTREVTLYSVFIGIVLVACMLVAAVLTQSDLFFGELIEKTGSILIYAATMHYFITLLVIVHRLYSLLHGGTLQ
jgi:hypothetical protein